MKSNIKKPLFVTLLFIITVILTALSIYYNYNNITSNDGLPVHYKWPYINDAIQLTLLSFFISTSIGLLKKINILKRTENENLKTELILFAFISGINLIILFFYYPGYKTLGLQGDPMASATFGSISIIQTIFFYLIIKKILNEKIESIYYVILLIGAILVILTVPYISGGGRSII